MFDPAPYTTGTPLQPRRPRPEPVAAEVSESGWYVIARNGHPPLPFAHRAIEVNPEGSVTTLCRITGRSVIELPIGSLAHLCTKCAGR